MMDGNGVARALGEELGREQQKRDEVSTPEPLIGTIWATSWGYDQTNVEFFQVVRETAKSVWVREIQQEAHDGRVWPRVGAFLDENSYHYRELGPDGVKRCLKPARDKASRYVSDSIRIDDIRYAYRYTGGGKYETFAAGGMGH
jgi:hypothetical protein